MSGSRGMMKTKGETVPRAGSEDRPGGSHEELLEEVLGKQILQVVVDALALVRRARLAHAQDRQAEVLDLDARLRGRPPRVLAALRVPLAVRAPVMVMMP